MAPRTESENAAHASSFNSTARPLAGPMHINEFYSQPGIPPLVSTHQVQCSNDRMALYRQHLSALGYATPPPLPSRPSQADPASGRGPAQTRSEPGPSSSSAPRSGLFSRRSRRQPASQQQQQGFEQLADESDSDPEEDLARYRADVATAKRGAPPRQPPPQPNRTVRPQVEGSARMAAVAGDVTAVDVMRYREELEAARQFEASVRDEESRRHFWRRKRKEPPPTSGPVMKGRYC